MVSRGEVDLTAAHSPAPQWRLVDRMLTGYALVVSALALSRLHDPGVPAVLAAHLAIPALVWLVVHAPPSNVVRALRAIYPLVLLSGLYAAIDILNRSGGVATWDHQIQSVEFAIFGMQPSRDWWRAHPSAFWSTLLHAVYLSYYALVAIPILALLVLRRQSALERCLTGVIATYLVCYLFALFLPVSGPYYQFDPPSGAFIDNLPARLVYAALASGSAFGAAFPSSHVGATVAAAIGAWHGSRRLGWALALPAALLVVAVVYCQMHYAVDSAAGLMLGIVMARLAARAH